MAENSKIDTGGPAFPLNADTAINPVTDTRGVDISSGLTKRDYFAAAALTGICANSYTPWSPNIADITDEQITKAAFDLADAMLAASKSGGSDE
jgi:hypothetical protein